MYSVKVQANDIDKSSKTENLYLIEKWLKEKKEEQEEFDSIISSGTCYFIYANYGNSSTI